MSELDNEHLRAASVDIAPKQFRILFTRGDELLPPSAVRGAFERGLERSLVQSNDISDDYAARAFAVSVTANACTEYLATTTAGVALKVVDPEGNAAEGTPLAHFLSIAPTLLADMTRSVNIFGRVYVRKVYNVAGYPTGLKYLNPLLVRERDDGRGRLACYILRHEDGRTEEVAPEHIIYKQVFDPRPFGNGLSKFEAAWLALNIEQSVSAYAAAFFVNGAQPDGFLTFDDPLTDDEYEDAKTEWQKNHKGVKNGHRTAVMPGGAKWQPTSTVPKDLAMIELKDAEREDICAIFGVDPILVGLKGTADPLSSNSTYSTAEVAHLRRVTLPFLSMILLPALNDQWAQKDFFPRGYYTLAVDEGAIPALVDAQLVKSDTAKNLTEGGLLDFHEARELLGYGERETGYMLRKPADSLALWEKSALTLNELRTLVFGQSHLGVNGDVVLVSGVLYPAARLAEIASANVDKLSAPPPAPFGLSTPPPPTPAITVTPPDVPLLPPARSAFALEVGVSFAGNQFVRYARRALSNALTALGVKAQWRMEDDWCLLLARTEQWTPTALASLMRSADYTETRKVDGRLTGFVQRGDALYVRIDGAVDSLQKAVGLDLRAAGLSADTSVDGILLATVDRPVEGLPSVDFPVVLNNVSLYMGQSVYHRWALRAASTAQTKELANAENVLRRKGREHSFTFEALAGTEIETWIHAALDAECELDDVFAVARAVQAGELSIRAYPETRDGFVSTITDLFMAAQNETTDRRNFAAQFRVQLRKMGLIAFRDGMESVNYKPESLAPQEVTVFRDWLNRQSGYVTGLGAELFKGGGITPSEVSTRVRMWADISLNEIYYQGIAAGSKTQRMRWVYDPGAEHCDDCPRLHDQIHTMGEWLKAGFLPGNGKTECEMGCRCRLEPTDETSRGAF